MIIKIVLILAVLIATTWLLRGRHTGGRRALTRLAWLGLTACWVVAVLAPNLVTWVANRMGVGLGTNLVLYVLVVAFTFYTILNQRRIRELEDRIATLARSHALLESELQSNRTTHV